MIDTYIQKYGRRLYGLCLHLCANMHDADDLYQETWVRAVQNFERYDNKQPFDPWITKICVNTYRNFLKHRTRSPERDIFTSDEEKDAFLESIPAPEREDYSDLHAAIDRLPDKLRMTVILYYFRDMDIKAAAAAMGVPAGTVKSRLSAARKMLKEVLGNEYLRF